MLGLVDVHCHFVPDWYVELAKQRGHATPDGMPAWPTWSSDEHLRFMDERGIARSLLSLSSPGIALGDNLDLSGIARRVNDDGAAIVASNPERFGQLASLPLPDVDAALEELDRILDVLGADGVVLSTHSNGTYLDDPSHEPLWEALAARECVVLIHPTSPPAWPSTSPERPRPMMEFIFDTTRTVMGMALSGVLTRHPRLRLVVPHTGSAIPGVLDRAALFQLGMRMALPANDPEHNNPPVTEAVNNLWWDLAGTPTKSHVRDLTERFGTRRIVYGSDFCFTPSIAVDLQLGLLDDVWKQLGQPDWRSLVGDNSARLLERPTPDQPTTRHDSLEN